MVNDFFTAAIRKASMMAGKPGRLLLLLSRLGMKLKEVDWKNVRVATAREKLYVLGRLIRAYALGHYREIPWKSILIIVAAIIYFINPIDLLPDFIPITGFTDDFAVLLWVYSTLSCEIDKFLAWENSRATG